ncbi:hypothetical protein GLOIN_2v1882276 [Rhizophagus clarus]|uniref:Uncharacterized protein n=1 Tax=Rhizophagus clarus TaxID=94130 RepID=A0A8H3KZJ8_9GLOM|nr:hypothetical protein GLOIN_2v1882276 [Rhizophagus clarus]
MHSGRDYETYTIKKLRNLLGGEHIFEYRSEIAELRKENAELKDKNGEIPDLKRKFAEIESEKVELKARIAKLLKQAVEESKRRDVENAKLRARIEELEKNKTVTTKLESENAEFRDRITKVEQRQVLNDNSSNISSSNIRSSNFNSVADQLSMETHYEIPLVDKEMDTSLPEEPIPEVTAKQSVSAVNIPVMDQCDQTSLKDKKTDTFLDEVHKKKVSNEIRQRKREKKLSQSHVLSQDSSSTTSESLHREADLSMTNTKHDLPEQKIEKKQVNLSEIKEAKIPYNQKVEQDLILKHILDVPIDAELTPGSVPHLAHLFDKVEKTGQKEKLQWYYYSKEYEKKVVALSSENNISDQMARMQIYDEMELYPPGKKREYLRKMIQKAKNIYTLFKGIGIDKIGVVTSSAEATSRLTNAQIQNIINLYTDESQKLIGVNNCSHTG